MAVAASMSGQDGSDDEHDHDMVMPGFRFHPTEEELVEFYLRRKVEGKPFNVELITFLDLYRYDPWELPGLAAIGEKEWFFYVPRDRKYRNGDRPNRVTTSGYWKATGADRMIRSENSRSIGLKKTLVFYSGKAPKGIRTSWIMNEYRLPHHETERLQKAEISICRVYKRAGVEDHPSLPRFLPTRASSSRRTQPDNRKQQMTIHAVDEKMSETSGSNSTNVGSDLGFSNPDSYPNPMVVPPPSVEEDRVLLHQLPRQESDISLVPLTPNCTSAFTAVGSSFLQPNSSADDDLHGLVNYQQQQQMFCTLLQPQSPQQLLLNNTNLSAASLQAAAFSDRLWDWNSMTEESNKDYNHPFK